MRWTRTKATNAITSARGLRTTMSTQLTQMVPAQLQLLLHTINNRHHMSLRMLLLHRIFPAKPTGPHPKQLARLKLQTFNRSSCLQRIHLLPHLWLLSKPMRLPAKYRRAVASKSQLSLTVTAKSKQRLAL